MGYIVIDTETSGLMDYKRDADAPGQPRVAEFAAIYLDDDLNIEREWNNYVMPDGWEMEPGAIESNGLTTDFLIEHGFPISAILDTYTQAIKEGRAVIAYGAQFDCKMMRAELRRAGRPDLFEETPNICIMRSLLSHAKQTGRKLIKYDDNGEPKETSRGWAKLSDACRYYGLPIPSKPHKAIVDAELTVRIFRAMVAEGFDRTPTIHYAKDLEAIRANR
jgi:DNA polymerase III epsilon subunit-like protein